MHRVLKHSTGVWFQYITAEEAAERANQISAAGPYQMKRDPNGDWLPEIDLQRGCTRKKK